MEQIRKFVIFIIPSSWLMAIAVHQDRKYWYEERRRGVRDRFNWDWLDTSLGVDRVNGYAWQAWALAPLAVAIIILATYQGRGQA